MNNKLTGLGVSQGIATGTVRIVTGIEDASNFKEGDILVTHITDPTMVSMMAKASAIVCEIGSITSHPSIVSRELGIPCVVSVKDATSLLEDGVKVEVNGRVGEVTILTEEGVEFVDNMDAHIDSIADATCAMDFNTFDVSVAWFRYDPLFAKGWSKRILTMIDAAIEKGIVGKKALPHFANMSDIRNRLLFCSWMAKYAEVGKEDRLKIFNYFTDILHDAAVDDPYAQNKNVIHSPEDVRWLVQRTSPATPEQAKILGRLVSACYHFAHATMSDMNPSNVYDNYGPYDVSDVYGPGHIAVVKQFDNLRPVELWPETINIPHKKIEMICVYKDVSLRVDAISHAIYEGDLISGLKHVAFLIDGKLANANEATKISELLEQWAARIFAEFSKYPEERKKHVYIHQKAYCYKKLADALGMDWRPTEEILAEARGKGLASVQWPADGKEQKELFKTILDPRIEWSP